VTAAETLIRGLRAIRSFPARARAPSNSNAQPWQVEVVSGQARDALADALQSALFAPDTAEARLAADVGMYGQTLLLAMRAHGVASCPQGLLSFYADTVRDTLGVRGGKLPFGISFGYADDRAPVNRIEVARAPLEETTRFHG
jgi:nitroreductase